MRRIDKGEPQPWYGNPLAHLAKRRSVALLEQLWRVLQGPWESGLPKPTADVADSEQQRPQVEGTQTFP